MTTNLALGLEPLIERYDAFVLDQYGCLHDGSCPYSGVNGALAALKTADKPIFLLSNSGKSAAHNRARLNKVGLDETVFDHVVTSGEFARSSALGRIVERFGNRVFRVVGDDENPTEFGKISNGIEFCHDPHQADFVLISGLPSDWTSERQKRLLLGLNDRSIPLVCINPDSVSPRPGGLVESPGKVAAAYENQGGTVVWIGKPAPEIYHRCIDLLGGIAPGKILFVGDSYDHDVVGAARVGGATLLLLCGILSETFKDIPSADWPNQADRLLVRDGIEPTWISWGLAQ